MWRLHGAVTSVHHALFIYCYPVYKCSVMTLYKCCKYVFAVLRPSNINTQRQIYVQFIPKKLMHIDLYYVTMSYICNVEVWRCTHYYMWWWRSTHKLFSEVLSGHYCIFLVGHILYWIEHTFWHTCMLKYKSIKYTNYIFSTMFPSFISLTYMWPCVVNNYIVGRFLGWGGRGAVQV